MSVIPVAVNTFGGATEPANVYFTTRDPVMGWQTPTLLYQDMTVSRGPALFSAGAITSALSSNVGVVVIPKTQSASATSQFVYVGNGPPASPVTVLISGRFGRPQLPGSNWDQAAGAFSYNSKLWLFLLVNTSSGFPPASQILTCLMSSDGGNTWAEQDAASAPVLYVNGDANNGQDFCVNWDGVSSKVQVFIQLASNSAFPCAVFEFDMSNPSTGWSQVTSTFNAGGILSSFNDFVHKFGNGDYGVMYRSVTTGKATYRLYSGGSWGSEIPIDGTGTGFYLAIPSADGETLHTFTNPNALGESNGVNYFQVAHNGTVSALLYTFTPAIGASDGVGFGVLAGTLLLVPYDDQNDNSNAVWECDLSVGTTFTKKLLPRPSGEAVGSVPSCAMVFFTVSIPTDPVSAGVDVGIAFELMSGGPFIPPPPPAPPAACETNPTPPGQPTLVLYNEPLEQQGT